MSALLRETKPDHWQFFNPQTRGPLAAGRPVEANV